jgi:hypothetical protein
MCIASVVPLAQGQAAKASRSVMGRSTSTYRRSKKRLGWQSPWIAIIRSIQWMQETMNCDPTASRRKVKRHVVVSRNDRAVQEPDIVVEDVIDLKREMMLDLVPALAQARVLDRVLDRELNLDLESRSVASPPGKQILVRHPVLRPVLLPVLLPARPSARLRRDVVQQVAKVKNQIRLDQISVAQNRSEGRL